MESCVGWKSREAAAVALEEPISSSIVPTTAGMGTCGSFARSVIRDFECRCFQSPCPESCLLGQTNLRRKLPLARHGFLKRTRSLKTLACFSWDWRRLSFWLLMWAASEFGLEALSVEEVWRCMQSSQPQFGYLYMAYAHFRAKHWVVRPGIQYGADFMAYRHHPALVHSDYAVVVMVEGQEERGKTWTEVQAMNRLCGSVAKTLLLLHVIPKCEGTNMSSPLCQGDFALEAVEVRRWLPEKNCEENDHPVEQNRATT